MSREVLAVGDAVVYRGQEGTPVFDAKVTSIQVWVPVLLEFVNHPAGDEASVSWEQVTGRDDGRAVIVCVTSSDDSTVQRWGYGSQICPPRS